MPWKERIAVRDPVMEIRSLAEHPPMMPDNSFSNKILP
jgi:hypothetical protein